MRTSQIKNKSNQNKMVLRQVRPDEGISDNDAITLPD